MNTILITLVFVIILILIWAFWGTRETPLPAANSTKQLSEEELLAEEQERAFRRRSSDRELEERLKEEKPPSRRRSDSVRDLNEFMSGRFELPYPIDQIISDSSRFRLYKRTLQNAEAYASKGDFNTALSLFEGVRSRVNDEETLEMIDDDIEYIKKFSEKKTAAASDKKHSDNLLQGIAKSGALRFTIDGPIPESINIGVIDPNRNLDSDKIAAIVSDGIRGEIASLRESISGLKGAGTGELASDKMSLEIGGLKSRISELAISRERILIELERLKGQGGIDRLDELKKNIENLSNIGESAKKIAEINDKLKEISDIADMKEDISRLNRRLGEISEREKPPQGQTPIIVEARSSSPIPVTIDPKPFLDLINAIPKNAAAMFAQSAGPRGGDDLRQSATAPQISGYNPPAEKTIEKEKIGEAEEDEGFELLSEYGSEKDTDTLTDEDIFEKILRDDPKGRGENAFEVIGEKEEDTGGEINIMDTEYEQKRRDNESFYRNLLNTDRRKKRELPILKVSYDFTKLPDEFSLSREKNILEYSFYRFKPMLEKAGEYIKNRRVRDAINYYNVIMGQNIPPEFKTMVRKNISDLTEYLEKYLASD